MATGVTGGDAAPTTGKVAVSQARTPLSPPAGPAVVGRQAQTGVDTTITTSALKARAS